MKRHSAKAFSRRGVVESISIPASIKPTDVSPFSHTVVQQIKIDEGVWRFRVFYQFLLDFDANKLIRHFGGSHELRIGSWVQVIGKRWFYGLCCLRTVACESGSTLHRIEDRAFSWCSSLKSIIVPSSVEIPSKACNHISIVTFGSGSLLREISFRCNPKVH
jgi:hypothetical protein